MIYRIEIEDKESAYDSLGAQVKKEIKDLGITKVDEVRFNQVYIIKGKISRPQITRIARELLSDAVTQRYHILPEGKTFPHKGYKVIEIAYNPGVMDPVEASVIKAINDLGITTVEAVHTAKKYLIKGAVKQNQLKSISEKILYNKLIQHVVKKGSKFYDVRLPDYEFKLIEVELLSADEKELMRLSREGQLFLNLSEMKTIQAYFKKKKRNPTDCELETIAQTWSEHCHHKTFRGKINYSEKSKGKTVKKKTINNLLKSTIKKATEELKKPWCVSVFEDNAGIIKFDKDYNVCFKVETHNHPSALEPFGGANTGVGGVIRDVLGTGLGAKPILNTDVFCFAEPDLAFGKLPRGTLHPKRIMKGVVAGVKDYGNKMGIPTVNGAICFDEKFVGNPLVYCGNVGIMPKDKSFKKAKKGDCIVAVGGRTGRDGIHGATFSSGELTHESEDVSGGAVQIGNPITEKKMMDVLLKVRDKNLYNAITDCGAGGFSSAVGEMGEKLGAKVYLDKAPLKYLGLSYTEIWISEAQERMVLSVPRGKVRKLIKEFEKENVEATVIGEFTSTKRLELFFQKHKVCDLDMKFLHGGIPQDSKEAVWNIHQGKEPALKLKKDYTQDLKNILSSFNVASKEWVIRQYDHEVQGGSVIKPLTGADNDGPSDAAVARPLLDSQKGLALSCGINPSYGKIDPFWMSASCIDEALRQIVAVGGDLKEVAILDNFCWGNPDKPDRLGSLVRAALGCYEAAKAFSIPFISGKDSLYNEYTYKGKSISIHGTILISALAVIEDVHKCITMDFKREGNLIYVLGETFDELGGSVYYKLKNYLGINVPKVNFKSAPKTLKALSSAINQGLVVSAHDCSEGGLAVALAEMCFSGRKGAEVFLREVPFEKLITRDDKILFSESNSRLVVEVEPEKREDFEKSLKNIPFGPIGRVNDSGILLVNGIDEQPCIKAQVAELKKYWQEPLKF